MVRNLQGKGKVFFFHSNKSITMKPKIQVSPLCGLIYNHKHLFSFRTVKGTGQVIQTLSTSSHTCRSLLSEMMLIEMPQEFGSVKNASTEQYCVRRYAQFCKSEMRRAGLLILKPWPAQNREEKHGRRLFQYKCSAWVLHSVLYIFPSTYFSGRGFVSIVQMQGSVCYEKIQGWYTPSLQSLVLALYPPGTFPFYCDF